MKRGIDHMIKVTVQKNLIGLEDLLVGVGTVQQNRGPTGTAAVTITRINGANLPYDADFSMQEKIDDLQEQIDTLPAVVDGDGNLLTGLINTSNLDLDLAGRLWRKTIDANTAEIYYGTELLFQYNPTAGNLIIPEDTDYIAADAVVTAAFQAADDLLQDDIDAINAALGTASGFDIGTGANNVVQLDGDGKLPAVDGSALTGIKSIPLGGMFLASYNTPDSGFLECNGAAINRTTYADLFAKIGTTFGAGDGSTTFNIPDMRGEFVRGWDNGRGVDSGRALGSTQEAATAAHTHAAGTLATAAGGGSHTHNFHYGNNTETAGDVAPSVALNRGTPESTKTGTTSSEGSHTHTITGSTGSTGGTETRPRNIALMWLIRVT